MNTPMLFDVPRTPTRIEVFKVKHQIETRHSAGIRPEWCALHMPTARKYGYGVTETSSLVDCLLKVGRLLDESGVAGYGDTEADAIVATCRACGITVLPADL